MVEGRSDDTAFNFEKLDAWSEAIALAEVVYRVTCSLPDHERFGLTNQLRRAAVSVSSNIAEGSARSRSDFARFIEIATGSLFEVVSQITLAQRLGYISDSDVQTVRRSAAKLSRILSGLRRSLRSASR